MYEEKPMGRKENHTREDIIGEIIQRAKLKLSSEQLSLVSAYVRQFYAHAAAEDLLTHTVDDLYGAALSHWLFIYKRAPGQAKIRVYNPNQEQHGWQSTHTIIEVGHDNIPFLVDTITAEVNRLGYTIHLIVHVGGLKLRRNSQHQVVEVLSPDDPTELTVSEAPIYMEIDRVTDPNKLEELLNSIDRVLKDVRLSVADWRKMRAKVDEVIDELKHTPPDVDSEDVQEAIDFLSWVNNDHFTFLGYREYEFSDVTADADDETFIIEGGGKDAKKSTKTAFRVVLGSGLGVLRDDVSTKKYRLFTTLPEAARKLALSPEEILIIAKTGTIATIHRPAYTDFIGVKRYDEKGKIIGWRRFLGLYTSTAYSRSATEIPYLRRKIKLVMEASKLPPKGHAGKALMHILENLPRDDVFQASVAELLELGMGVFHLQERQRTRLFARKDIYGRFISCLVYVPRERYDTELRKKFQAVLKDTFKAEAITFETQFSESILARIHFLVRINPEEKIEYEISEIERKLVRAGRRWDDDLRDNLIDYYGEERGNELVTRYCTSFPASYREAFVPRTAVYDIEHIETLTDEHPLALSFYQPVDEFAGEIHFKLYRRDKPIPLSDVLPILEDMGLRVLGERPHKITLPAGGHIWINDFGMITQTAVEFNIEDVKCIFQEAFKRIWNGDAEDDGFNALVLTAQLSWDEVSVLRAYCKYLRQIGFTFSQTYIEETLSANPHIATQLIDLFKLRFNPETHAKSEASIAELEQTIQENLEQVVNLDQDRILRRYLDVIHATLRTNYFQRDAQGNRKIYMSFKFLSNQIPDMPLPLPMFEIFVYSPCFEGVHLRANKVARGGLRWSDRREDFRTEILGLMKAQQVKNAVIVPSGAKGGFVPKCLPVDGDREHTMNEVVRCYTNFIRGLLDITDNMKAGEIHCPANTICYDDYDPYLVVAADKGTATFSDIANGIALEYDFWLGDAFASGGSAGYDHKKMGITARGAWVSVMRHFREIGVNTQDSDFTVVGVGDMGGDVFGNGMLLSKHIKLVAVFNHLHIFLDPDPDAEKSFDERSRLFNLARSTWDDYDKELISEGGGVFRRSAKSIQLTPQVKKLLNVDADRLEPNQLIQAILKARVDLLWNGGIGTFAKASTEQHSEVGDRTNDAIRVNANELNCKVIGEGGNLGVTQLARVEMALLGGAVYTDFIDNSAGVNCSDQEVNIKILLNDIVSNGDLTEKQRNKLLVDMTDDVAEIVLLNNYRQTQAVSLTASQAAVEMDQYARYLTDLEQRDLLDRELEFLPDDKGIIERKAQNKGLTAPEISVLLAYAKNITREEIINSDLLEDTYLVRLLKEAFPTQLVKEFSKPLLKHSLRNEIIATELSNKIVNDMGIMFVNRLQEETGAMISSIGRAYMVIQEVFDMPNLWKEIEALDYKVTSDTQYKMMLRITRLIRRATRWFLCHYRGKIDITAAIEQFKAGVQEFSMLYPSLLIGAEKDNYDTITQVFVSSGVPAELASKVAGTSTMLASLDVIHAAQEYGFAVKDVASVYFELGDRLQLSWFRDQLSSYPVENHWETLARSAYRDDLDQQHRQLAVGVISNQKEFVGVKAKMEGWMEKYASLLQRWNSMLDNLRSSTSLEMVMFSVALRELLDLTQTCTEPASVEEPTQTTVDR